MSHRTVNRDSMTHGAVGEVTVQFEPGATLVTLSGEIDVSHGADTSAAAEDAIERGLPVLIDVSKLTFLDSTVLGFVATMVRTGREQGWRPILIGASRIVSEALALAGLRAEVDLVHRS